MEPFPPFGDQGKEATEYIAQRFMPEFHCRHGDKWRTLWDN
jgi:hypothetical protein